MIDVDSPAPRPPDLDDLTITLESLPAIGPEGRGELVIAHGVDADSEVEERAFVPWDRRG